MKCGAGAVRRVPGRVRRVRLGEEGRRVKRCRVVSTAHAGWGTESDADGGCIRGRDTPMPNTASPSAETHAHNGKTLGLAVAPLALWRVQSTKKIY